MGSPNETLSHEVYALCIRFLEDLSLIAGQCDPTHLRVCQELSAQLNLSLSLKGCKDPSTDRLQTEVPYIVPSESGRSRKLAPFILLAPCRVCDSGVTYPDDGLHRRRTSGVGEGDPQDITAFPSRFRGILQPKLIGLHSSVVPEESLALMTSFSRLAHRPCRWRRCTAILNSLGSLLAHIHRFHVSCEGKHLCEWDACRKRFGEEQAFTRHVQSHFMKKLPCAYEDCYQVFKSSRELGDHHHQHLDRGDILKPSSEPAQPSLRRPPPLDLHQGSLAPPIRISSWDP
ncbi:hypothetical protein R3P38DRAFT_3049912 [Favolaschia claudopus]|uniref:C2H2-type domain-containing protein n=1 Tax=Favolaschia claudopus TaxID=2862362 RepID=A0AAW0A598_9AGAR